MRPLLVATAVAAFCAAAAADQTPLTNGDAWIDTDGNQIEAHGGCILKIGGVYHWYGSTKKELDYKGAKCLFECSLGINLYTSTDLLSWKFAGLVFNHTQIDVPAAGLPGGNVPVLPFRIERPKVIYNAQTKMYVLVFHCEDAPYKVGLRGVARSPTPTGPFEWVHAENPNGLFSMDMTEYVDPNDPKQTAYHIRTARFNPDTHKGPNTQWTVGSQLSADYLTTAPGAVCFNASVSAEGQAMMYHNGAYYMFASHLSGLAVNAARLLRCRAKILSDCCTPAGAPTKWEDLGNPAVGSATTPEGDGPSKTFNSQSTFVLPLEDQDEDRAQPKKAVGLWMGDRWNPDPKRSNVNGVECGPA
eukprot:g2166.t1